MMRSFTDTIAVLFLILCMVGCKKDITPEFELNDQVYPTLASFPKSYESVRDSIMTIDSGAVLKVEAVEAKGINSWYWYVDNVDQELDATSNPGFEAPFQKTPGFHHIKLCVDESKINCVTKYIYVNDITPENAELPAPVIIVTLPSSNPENVESSTMKLLGTVTHIKSQGDIEITLNNKTIQKIEEYDDETGEFEVHVKPLQKGKNKISIRAGNLTDTVTHDLTVNASFGGNPSPRPPAPSPTPVKPTPVKPALTKALPNSGISGMDVNEYDKSCGSFAGYEFTTKITPKTDIQLLSFVVFTDVCGGLKLTITGQGINETVNRGLTSGQSGKSTISLGDLDLRLKAGKTYSIKGSTLKNFAGCTNPNKPKLLNASACGAPRSTGELKIDHAGNIVLFDLKYMY